MREKAKAKQKKFKKVFEKRRLNSISEVEYFRNRIVIRVILRFKIEQAIIIENISRFILAYTSPLLQSPLIEQHSSIATTSVAEAIIS